MAIVVQQHCSSSSSSNAALGSKGNALQPPISANGHHKLLLLTPLWCSTHKQTPTHTAGGVVYTQMYAPANVAARGITMLTMMYITQP